MPNSIQYPSCVALAVALLAPFAKASPIRIADQDAGDDENISTISPFPTPSYQTYCNWILQGLDNRGFTPANGYNFAFAGSGVAAAIPNVPMSDFNAVVYRPWAATDVGFKDLGGQYISRPVVNQEAGGADFELAYTPRPNSTDPTSVNFVQAYIDNVNGVGFRPGTLDVPKKSTSPYYNAVGIAGTLKSNVAWMADIPYTCEDNGNNDCSGGTDDARVSEEVDFQTFVAGANPVPLKDANGNEKNYIVLYGGVQWGYAYTSIDIPEPAFGAFAGLLALVLATVGRQRCKHFLLRVLPLICCGALSMTARAATISDFDAATEALIDASTDTFSYLPRLFGSGYGSVNFTSQIDPLGQSLSFSSVPGSTFNGEPLTMSVAGIYDASELTWNFTMTGAIGNTSLDMSGDLIYADTLKEKADDRFSWFPPGGVEYDIESFHRDVGGISHEEYFFTINGTQVGGPIIGPDASKNGKWNFDIEGSGLVFNGVGSNDPGTGSGSFVITSVPECPTLLMLALGLGLMSLCVKMDFCTRNR
jgi:hypothetical protein